MEKVEDVKGPLIVGRKYLVKCIKDHVNNNWVPIVGPAHDDAEILKFPVRHYHNDTRFVPNRFMDSWLVEHDVIPIEENKKNPHQRAYEPVVIEYKVRVCKNNRPFRKPYFKHSERAFNEWQKKFAEKECTIIKGHICPHKGFDLSQQIPDEDGNVICPGHGLKFNLETGKQVIR